MLTKLGPFQGHHLFLKEKYSLKSCTYLCSHAVEYPSFEHHPQWQIEDFPHVVNPPGGTQLCQIFITGTCDVINRHARHLKVQKWYRINAKRESLN